MNYWVERMMEAKGWRDECLEWTVVSISTGWEQPRVWFVGDGIR